MLSFAQNRLDEAEEMYRQSLAIRLEVYGPDHAKVAVVYNNLGNLLRQNVSTNIPLHYPLWRCAVQMWIVCSLSFVRILFVPQGKLKEAADMYEQAIGIKKKVYDDDHPSLATSYNNLADVYRQDVSFG